ncbi:unnamed protein product [Brachionus calyciflorus]|uniref:Uncharacterized protein n=1 Tax=Brachionus calyciflorus TaxID=104777 RepID=A0A813PVP1_9BILA|nr:unnamed protein product [Brachionus calyciflorus]
MDDFNQQKDQMLCRNLTSSICERNLSSNLKLTTQSGYLKYFSAKIVNNANLSTRFRDMNFKNSNLLRKRQGFACRREFSKSHEADYQPNIIQVLKEFAK